MATYRAMSPVLLSIPNKLKANGQPAASAQWRSVSIPADSLFTYNGPPGWMQNLITATSTLVTVVEEA